MGCPSAARALSRNQRLRFARRNAFVPTTRTLFGMHRAQPLSEALEAAQGAVGGGVVEAPAVAQAGGEAHHLAQPVQYDQLAVRVARHHHVKAVGAKIDGGEDVGNDTTAAHLRGHCSRPRMKTRNRRLSWRLGCE